MNAERPHSRRDKYQRTAELSSQSNVYEFRKYILSAFCAPATGQNLGNANMNTICGGCTVPPRSVFRNAGLSPQLLGVLKAPAARSLSGLSEHRRPHLIPRGPHIAWLIKVGPSILTPTWDNSEVIPTSGLPRGLTKASIHISLLCSFPFLPKLLPILHFPSTGIDPQSTQPVNLLSEETGSSVVSQERSLMIVARFIRGKVTNDSTFSERQ